MTISEHGNQLSMFRLQGLLSNDFLVACLHPFDRNESELIVWNPADGQFFKSCSTGFKDVQAVLVLSNDQIAVGGRWGAIKIIDLEDSSKTRMKKKAYDLEVSRLLQLSNENLVSAGVDGQPSSYYSCDQNMEILRLEPFAMHQCSSQLVGRFSR